jgi:hypothetical protein
MEFEEMAGRGDDWNEERFAKTFRSRSLGWISPLPRILQLQLVFENSFTSILIARNFRARLVIGAWKLFRGCRCIFCALVGPF